MRHIDVGEISKKEWLVLSDFANLATSAEGRKFIDEQGFYVPKSPFKSLPPVDDKDLLPDDLMPKFKKSTKKPKKAKKQKG